MAAKTTFGLARTNNAAKDDIFSGASIDWLAEGGGLTGSLSVLGNDPGSASLYALHGSEPEDEGQMEGHDCAEFTVEYGESSYTGTLTANPDGTVEFDLSSLDGVLGLAEGETLEVSFYYTAQMGNGALSTAEVTVEITGVGEAGEPAPPDAGAGDPSPVPISNGGFEHGDFTGWSATGSTVVTDQFDFEGTLVTAQEGSYMAVLSTDMTFAGSPASSADLETFLGISANSLTGIGNGTAVEGSAIETSVFLATGQTLSFDYFFDTQDPGGTSNDFAFITVASSTASEIVDADLVQPDGDSGWQTYSFTATADGNYDIGVGVTDVSDNFGTSLLYVDNFTIV